MRLSLGDRIRYWIFGYGSFPYPKAEVLAPKPWHPDGDAAYMSIPRTKLPNSDRVIAHMAASGPLGVGTGLSVPAQDGVVRGVRINKARKNDPVLTISRTVGAGQLHVETGYSAPYGGTVRVGAWMFVEGNPMDGYSDNKMHVYEDLADGSVKVTEIQNYRDLPWARCDGVSQYTLDQASTDVRGQSVAQLSIIGHTTRYDDLIRAKQIRRMALSIRQARSTFIPPARGSDGVVGADPKVKKEALPDNPDAPAMGTILRLTAATEQRLAAAGITRKTNPQTFAVLDCLTGPGAVILDTGGTNSLGLEPDPQWDQRDLAALRHVRMTDFEAWTL